MTRRAPSSSGSVEDMHRSLRQIEEVVVDLHARVIPPLDRIPLTRGRRRREREAG